MGLSLINTRHNFIKGTFPSLILPEDLTSYFIKKNRSTKNKKYKHSIISHGVAMYSIENRVNNIIIVIDGY